MRRRAVVALLAVVVSGLAAFSRGGAAADLGPRAYYLFLADAPKGCEDCYVPLLVVGSALEDVASAGRDTDRVDHHL
jgi:hypothetical protein